MPIGNSSGDQSRPPPDVRWVLVESQMRHAGTELGFAVSELRRSLPQGSQWCFSLQELRDKAVTGVGKDLVLWIRHPYLSLESRCLERLALALDSGYDIVEACDSNFFEPMRSPNYATVRGMERYVDANGELQATSKVEGSESNALLRMTTLDTVLGNRKENLRVGRVVGAYLHNVVDYSSGERAEILPLIPQNAQVCLDVGGGEGNFLRLLKSRFNVETHLVELNPAVAERAREAGCADFVTAGDFIQYETDLLFDSITFLDMLEHVEEPSKYLSKAAKLLNTNGRVIASIPNVGHWSVVFDLLEGRWDYAPSGIHCITHLRFFTLNSIRKLFEGSGFVLEKIERVIIECPVNITKQSEALGALQIDAQSLDTYAYLIVARLG